MQYFAVIDHIISRAERLNIRPTTLYRLAGSDPSLWFKWRHKGMNPTFRVFAREREKVEAYLDEREAELRDYLNARADAPQAPAREDAA